MDYLILAGVVVAILWMGSAWAKSRPPGAGSAMAARFDEPSPTLRQTGKYFRQVVGESHYRPALASITGNRILPGLGMKAMAALVCENDNRFDTNAVRVDVRGKTVGYLSREDALDYRRRLRDAGMGESTQWVAARIGGGGEGRHYGVYLDLPDRLVDR